MFYESSLFEQENVNEGKSLAALASWGKIESFEETLRTSFKVLSSQNLERKS